MSITDTMDYPLQNDNWWDEDFDDIEDRDVVMSFDPSTWDDVEEMVVDFDSDLFYTVEKFEDPDDISLNLVDQLDWDSLDYE